MKIIPVLDILGGSVVRGIAGQRDQYYPINSPLCAGSKPLDVAGALSKELGLKSFYLADLDAILNDVPQWSIYQKLIAADFELMVDAGINNVKRVRQLLKSGIDTVVVGLETLPSFQLLEKLVDEFGPQRIMFSLDMKQGQLMGNAVAHQTETPAAVVQKAIDTGIQRLLVLELSAVGTGQGPTTAETCQQISAAHPEIELLTGGGIRNSGDILHLSECGVNGVLISSALHSGQIGPNDVVQFSA